MERHKDRADVKEKRQFVYDVSYSFSGKLQYPSCVDALALHPVLTWGRQVAIRPENLLESPVNFAITPGSSLSTELMMSKPYPSFGEPC